MQSQIDVPDGLERELREGATSSAAGPFVRPEHDAGPALRQERGATGPVRVAYCLDSMEGSGGTESNAVRTAEAIDPSRVQLTVFAMRPEGPMRARYAAAGVPVVPTPRIATLVAPYTAGQVVRLARSFREHETEVVHCHDTYTNWFAGLAARVAGIPLLTSKRWIGGERRHLLLSRVAYRVSTRVLANSQGVARTLIESDGVSGRRVVVVPNFVEDAAFATPSAADVASRRAAWGVGSRHPVIGCVARLRPEKGQETLLRAAARLIDRWPNLGVVLVGDGPQEMTLRTLAAELGITDRVFFTGHQPNRPNPHALFDVSVLASDHEGFPNTVIEAMAAGRPVVASNVGGVPDAVRDEQTGLLTPPRNPAAVADALARLLDAPQWAAALGVCGQEIAHAEFTRAPVLEHLMTLYHELAGRSTLAVAGTAL